MSDLQPLDDRVFRQEYTEVIVIDRFGFTDMDEALRCFEQAAKQLERNYSLVAEVRDFRGKSRDTVDSGVCFEVRVFYSCDVDSLVMDEAIWYFTETVERKSNE